jgi:deoxyribose-phosphate aldolase
MNQETSSVLYAEIARMIDHSLLRPDTPTEEFEQGCRLAAELAVGSVCIQPYYLRRCAEILQGSGVRASTVIGFPHGGHATRVKEFEAVQAIADGGEELDLVCNVSKVLSGDWSYVRSDIQAVIDVAHGSRQNVKVIFENCYLTDAHKIRLCEICSDLKADWVKTSTGFGSSGATQSDVQLMRRTVSADVQVKAAGGIRTLELLLAYRALGVTRIGTSATAAILNELQGKEAVPPSIKAPGTEIPGTPCRPSDY